MYDTGIIELRQSSETGWKAKYNGNYGIYTIKITINGEKTVEFSCSCPSDYYPCKHIPMVERAIAERLAINKRLNEHGGLKPEDLIRNVSAEKLRKFIIDQSKYNPELSRALFLEFAADAENTKDNKYSKIIHKALAAVDYDDYEDYDDYYYSEEGQEIDELDQWIEKACDCIELEEYEEAILISKAIIEEYSRWLTNMGSDSACLFSSEYQSVPFDIIEQASEHSDKKELFDYCLSEMKKEKYAKTDFLGGFHGLLESLAVTVDPDAFIALQDKLLAGIADKSSYEAKKILGRKIQFFKRIGQEEKAWDLIKENMQIESFCLDVVNKKIEEQDFAAAKKLINEFLEERKKDANSYINDKWHKLLLDIAQKENDIPAIRELAYGFIKTIFNEEYYKIYKAAFSPAEWAGEREILITHYCKKNYFNRSAADFLAAESDTGRLINYIEKYPTVDNLEKYFTVLSYDYPEKTLDMFKKAVVSYAGYNTGRTHYENILSLLKKMSRIKGGKKAASELAAEFRVRYKNRRAMMEILRRFT